MKKNEDKELDNLFKNKLEDPVYQPGYLEDDWDALESMLDKSKKRTGFIFWLPVLSSAAAILIFFGWWFFTTPVIQHNQLKQQQSLFTAGAKKNMGASRIADNQKSGDKIKSVASSSEAKSLATPQTDITVPGGNNPKKELTLNVGRNAGRNNVDIEISNNGKDNSAHEKNLQEIVKNNQPAITSDILRADATTLLAAVNSGLLIDDLNGTNKNSASAPVESKDIVRNRYNPDPIKSESDVTKLGFVKRPQLALAFIGASELNGANSLGDGKSGTNVGLMFSAGIFNKLTVSTGANYSVKPYNTDIANYHTNYTFKTNPVAIEADCRVLDIPINLDYQLYNKHKNKFSVGTGLSSYIMLHESYNYYYADPTTKGPVAYTVAKPGKYFFGVMNLQATYQRQVNSKVGISVEPYMKLPLTNIGYSQIKLQTAGVAVGLNWNINSLTKP